MNERSRNEWMHAKHLRSHLRHFSLLRHNPHCSTRLCTMARYKCIDWLIDSKLKVVDKIMGIFQDDEYAVYDTSQQRIRYLVEFTMPGDVPLTEFVVSESTTADVECTSKESPQKGTFFYISISALLACAVCLVFLFVLKTADLMCGAGSVPAFLNKNHSSYSVC